MTVEGFKQWKLVCELIPRLTSYTLRAADRKSALESCTSKTLSFENNELQIENPRLCNQIMIAQSQTPR